MRLIDIDPIVERLKNAIYLGKRIGEDTENLKAVLADIEAQPTAEPELIRCKDCKFYKGLAVCMIHGEKCGGTNYFCAWAERRTDG